MMMPSSRTAGMKMKWPAVTSGLPGVDGAARLAQFGFDAAEPPPQ